METDSPKKSSYGKRPLWQWILIYIVIGLIVYGLIYYFVASQKGGIYNTSKPVSQDSGNTIFLTESGFLPSEIVIKAGSIVTFINESGKEATVNSSPHPQHTDYSPLNLGVFKDGGKLNIKFDKAGTYKYHNHLNPSQFGSIIVE